MTIPKGMKISINHTPQGADDTQASWDDTDQLTGVYDWDVIANDLASSASTLVGLYDGTAAANWGFLLDNPFQTSLNENNFTVTIDKATNQLQFDFGSGTPYEHLGYGQSDSTTFYYVAQIGQGAYYVSSVTLTVDGENTAPVLHLPDAFNVNEEASHDLVISADEVDDNAHLSYTVSGLQDATLNHGTYNPADDTWTLTPNQLSGLQIIAGEDDNGNNKTLTVHVVVTNTEGPTQTQDSGDVTVTVLPVPEPPHLSLDGVTIPDGETAAQDYHVGPFPGTVGVPTPLTIAVTPQDGDDTLSVTVHVDAAITLSNGTTTFTPDADGNYTFTDLSQLQGLTITTQTAGNMTIEVIAHNAEGGGADTVGFIDWPVSAPAGEGLVFVPNAQHGNNDHLGYFHDFGSDTPYTYSVAGPDGVSIVADGPNAGKLSFAGADHATGASGTIAVTATGNGGSVDQINYDFLIGDNGDNTLTATLSNGSAGAIIDGNGGSDTLSGTSLADFIFGGSAGDTLIGGGGGDWLNGGAGADTYKYLAAADSQSGTGNYDTIVGFTDNGGDHDWLDLSQAGVTAGNIHWSFNATTNETVVTALATGGDMEIHLVGNIDLTNDLILHV